MERNMRSEEIKKKKCCWGFCCFSTYNFYQFVAYIGCFADIQYIFTQLENVRTFHYTIPKIIEDIEDDKATLTIWEYTRDSLKNAFLIMLPYSVLVIACIIQTVRWGMTCH